MLKQQARLFTKLAILIDLLSIMAAFVLAFNVVQMTTGRLTNILDYSWILMLVVPVWLFLMTYFGLYESMRTKTVLAITTVLVKVHVAGGVLISSSVFLIHDTAYSRLLLGTFIILTFVLITLAKVTINVMLRSFRRRGYNSRNLLIAGSGNRIGSFVDVVRQHTHWGLVITGIVNLPGEAETASISGCPRLGALEDLVDICKRNMVDEVIFSLPCELLSVIEEYLVKLQDMGIVVRMVLDLYDAPTSRKELSMFHNIPILTYHSKAFDAGQLFLKRCLDILGALVGLLITGLFLPFIALAIRFESRGPLLFGQKRVGENGRLFTCWKFRSMFVDAEERKKELMDRNEMQGAMFKIKDDPRITGVGKFIRKTSLDELPQFWNVLVGEMSLVGTRPPTPDEVATYQNWHRKRICIKPGMTGLWQVSGRNQIQDFDEVVRLDIKYIENWSLWLDIKLLFKTVWVVLARSGAR